MRNFNHLYYFYVVSKLGSVTGAAKALNTSQSSLSMQLKTLESQLGRKLFERSRRKIALSPEGQRVFQYCRRMFDVARELDSFLSMAGNQGHSSFSIGVSNDIERPFVTDILSRTIEDVARRHRPVFSQVTFPPETLLAKLEMGELDAVLSSQPLHSHTIRTEIEVVLAVKAIASPKLGKRIRTMMEDQETGLVLPTLDLRIRWETDEFLTRKKVRKTVAFESNVMGALLRACVDGLGVGFLPEPYVVNEIKRGTLVSSRESLWNHRLFLSTRRSLESDESRAMVQALTNQLVRASRLR